MYNSILLLLLLLLLFIIIILLVRDNNNVHTLLLQASDETTRIRAVPDVACALIHVHGAGEEKEQPQT